MKNPYEQIYLTEQEEKEQLKLIINKIYTFSLFIHIYSYKEKKYFFYNKNTK